MAYRRATSASTLLTTIELLFALCVAFGALTACRKSHAPDEAHRGPESNRLSRIDSKGTSGSRFADSQESPHSAPGECPNNVALEQFKYQIGYERTWELNLFKGLSTIHTDVSMRGPLTGFYIREALPGLNPRIRDSYIFGQDGLQGGGTCPLEQDWRRCLEEHSFGQLAGEPTSICSATIDLRSIPDWRPSPNDESKRRIAGELRRELETRWQGVQHIVVRDFNLKDNQIEIYFKMPDGEYFRGCAFNAAREPHCDTEHGFGMAPTWKIRKRIMEMPYRLK